jgi:hypothetical protein
MTQAFAASKDADGHAPGWLDPDGRERDGGKVAEVWLSGKKAGRYGRQ